MPKLLKQKADIPVDEVPVDGEGSWVKMRRWLTLEDRDRMNTDMTKIDLAAGKGNIDVSHANTAALAYALVGWGGPGFCVKEHDDAREHTEGENGCEAVALTIEHVAQLPDPISRRLLSRLSEFNPTPIAPSPLVNGATAAGKS